METEEVMAHLYGVTGAIETGEATWCGHVIGLYWVTGAIETGEATRCGHVIGLCRVSRAYTETALRRQWSGRRRSSSTAPPGALQTLGLPV